MVQAPEPAVQKDWSQPGFPLGSFGPMPEEMENYFPKQIEGF
jgi:glycine amidinotransferase